MCAQSISLALRLECLQYMVRVILDHVVLDAAPTSSSRSPTTKDVFKLGRVAIELLRAHTYQRDTTAPPRNCHGLKSAHSSSLAFS